MKSAVKDVAVAKPVAMQPKETCDGRLPLQELKAPKDQPPRNIHVDLAEAKAELAALSKVSKQRGIYKSLEDIAKANTRKSDQRIAALFRALLKAPEKTNLISYVAEQYLPRYPQGVVNLVSQSIAAHVESPGSSTGANRLFKLADDIERRVIELPRATDLTAMRRGQVMLGLCWHINPFPSSAEVQAPFRRLDSREQRKLVEGILLSAKSKGIYPAGEITIPGDIQRWDLPNLYALVVPYVLNMSGADRCDLFVRLWGNFGEELRQFLGDIAWMENRGLQSLREKIQAPLLDGAVFWLCLLQELTANCGAYPSVSERLGTLDTPELASLPNSVAQELIPLLPPNSALAAELKTPLTSLRTAAGTSEDERERLLCDYQHKFAWCASDNLNEKALYSDLSEDRFVGFLQLLKVLDNSDEQHCATILTQLGVFPETGRWLPRFKQGPNFAGFNLRAVGELFGLLEKIGQRYPVLSARALCGMVGIQLATLMTPPDERASLKLPRIGVAWDRIVAASESHPLLCQSIALKVLDVIHRPQAVASTPPAQRSIGAFYAALRLLCCKPTTVAREGRVDYLVRQTLQSLRLAPGEVLRALPESIRPAVRDIVG